MNNRRKSPLESPERFETIVTYTVCPTEFKPC